MSKRKNKLLLATVVMSLFVMIAVNLPLAADDVISYTAMLDEAAIILPVTDGSSAHVNGATVSLETARTEDGEYADVTLSLDANPGIWTLQVNLSFDETKLTPVYITEGDIQDFDFEFSPVEGRRTSSRLTFIACSDNEVHDTGRIATVRFRMNEIAGRQLPVAISHFAVVAVNEYNEILHSYATADDNLLAATGIQVAETFSTTSNVPVGGILFGDVDGNGQIDVGDLTRLRQYLANWQIIIDRRASDVDVNGHINSGDVTRFSQYLADWPVYLGPSAGSITIIPEVTPAMPVYQADIKLYVNNVLTERQISSGVISFSVPQGRRVQFDVTAGGLSFNSPTITSFNYNNIAHRVQRFNMVPDGTAFDIPIAVTRLPRRRVQFEVTYNRQILTVVDLPTPRPLGNNGSVRVISRSPGRIVLEYDGNGTTVFTGILNTVRFMSTADNFAATGINVRIL